MQPIGFDFWSWLLMVLGFLGTCTANPVSGTTSSLTIPKEEVTQGDYSKIATKLTLILLRSGKAFAYEGNDINSGTIQENTSLHKVIFTAKRKFSSPEFIVLIKPTIEADYGSTVDVLDEMAIQKIDRYAIVNLTPLEAAKLNIKDGSAN